MPAQAKKVTSPSPLQKGWAVIVDPDGLFRSLQEPSIGYPVGWIISGVFLIVVVGGILSVLLSLAVGIPLAQALAFVQESDASWLAYLLFLGVWFLELAGASMVGLFFYSVGGKILRGEGSMLQTAQILAYASTPMFVAFALPQFLVKEFSTLHPLMRIIATSYNYSVDFVQLASLVWSAWLMYRGAKILHGFSGFKAWVFVIVPGAVIAEVLVLSRMVISLVGAGA